jgi:hypothetical protein
MSEAEVSLRLVFWLIRQGLISADDPGVSVAIDGAQVKAGRTVVFDVKAFLQASLWRKADSERDWRGEYRCPGVKSGLTVRSVAGCGDVVCRLRDGRLLLVEAKKGPLRNSLASEEYPLLHQALGQLLANPRAGKGLLLAVAVPWSPRFEKLAWRFREAPLVRRLGIHILTVGRDNEVDGLSALDILQYERQRDAAGQIETLDSMVRREFCYSEPAQPLNDLPGYMNFARAAMRKLLQIPPGTTRDLTMTRLIRDRTSRGCKPELLLRIARVCLDWIPPEDRPVSKSRA